MHLGLSLTLFAFLGLSLGHTVTNANKLPVNILETRSDAVLDGLLYLLLDETSGKWLQSLVQEIVLRISDRELERGDLGVHGLDLEHRGVVLRRGHDLDLHVNTFTAKDEICEAGVLEPGKTCLLSEVEGDVANIRLNLAENEFDFVFGIVVDSVVGREFEVVPGRYLDDIGEQVLAREREVLDDEVE